MALSSLAKRYDLIIVGSGSATNLLEPLIQQNPKIKIALIDKDDPGGICLTRGCIPSKIILYPAELVRTIEAAKELGVSAEIKEIDFKKIMSRMRDLIGKDIESIRAGLSSSENIDYYHSSVEFISPYTMQVDGQMISSPLILLCTGSKIVVPPIKGLEEAGYLTSDSALRLDKLPESILIVGGGYIAAEFGHFFSSMGAKVTIIGRNPQFLPEEEPEISALAAKEFRKHLELFTNLEVIEASVAKNRKKLIAKDRSSGSSSEFEADEIMIACGRGPLNDLLHPERAGIKTTPGGWIEVNEYMETSQPNVWAIGDADGKFLFKHVANYESQIVYYNMVLKQRIKADYSAIPHAVFTYPEIAAVGMRELDAIKQYGAEGIMIGFYKFENTAKGEAMNLKDYFVKVIVARKNSKILGAHIIGPEASVLIQEIINVMYTEEKNADTVNEAIHIHPALTEVVQRAFQSMMPVPAYHHFLEQH
jgi:mycothione reductase